MQEVGTAKSQMEAAKKIVDETGETFDAVHHRVKRGAKEMGQGGHLNQTLKQNQTLMVARPVPDFSRLKGTKYFLDLKSIKFGKGTILPF